LLVLTAVVIAVSIVSIVSTARDGRREATQQTEHLQATAQVIASLSSEGAAQRDPGKAFAAIRAIGAMPEVLYARIETAEGGLLAETGQGVRLSSDVRATGAGGGSILAALRSRTVEVSSPVVYARQPVGKVVLLGRLDGVAGRLRSSLLIGFMAALAAGGLALIVSARLQRRITSPVLALTDAMARVRTDHDYTRPVAIEADGEVGDLVDGFNAMLGQIRDRDSAIADHMASLEQTVAERTADLSAARDAADAANSAKSDFLATMSHEIRTPMNGIMVMAEMLAASEVPPRQRRFAEVIAKSGSSLLAIINDILDFSKIEAGKLDLEAAPLDPSEIADDVCSLFWERARSKGVDLAAYVDPAVPAVIEADAVRLRQVVGNLINNAIKFTETGGVFVEMTAPAPNRLRVAVHDTGIGIAQDKLGGLFSAFTQADQSTTRRFGGTGLGLAICKRLVETMGGQVMVRSQVGKGSVFGFDIPVTVLAAAEPWPRLEGAVALTVSEPSTRTAMRRYLNRAGLTLAADGQPPALTIATSAVAPAQSDKSGPVIVVGEYGDAAPAQLLREGRADAVLIQPFRRRELEDILHAWAAGQPLAEAVEQRVETERGSLPSFAGARVLVADDSAVNREVALEALSRLNITAQVACDGRQAVDAVAAERFDLVLMDGSMPELDGYEATRQIRRREAEAGAPRLPVVALTAHVVGAAAEAWREAGMDGVLHKPFTLASLAQVLGGFLTASREAPSKASAAQAAAAPAAPPPSDLLDPVVQAELADMAAAGRADFVSRVRALYRDNAPNAAAAVAEYAAAGDALETARAAHSLKSMSLNIGARAVAELAGKIEAACHAGARIVQTTTHELQSVLTATLAALDGEASPAQADPELALVADLAKAAERGEFRLMYQRQVDRGGQEITGVEALLRWRHPTRGEVSPAEFIPIAERHGLMRPITQWVLAKAIEETATLPGLSVGVNASAVEFADPHFVSDISAVLARTGFDPTRLEIEITETSILNDGEVVRSSIARLHELGVRIALDDFGVGYSSLSHLRMFPFDKLKIDRAFITDCIADVASATLVHAVVSVGRALGMKVVAEGIETEEQQKFLKVAGVHAMQGYLFGRPEPINALRAALGAEPAALSSWSSEPRTLPSADHRRKWAP
jgi:EAL domain-containing protein (putative c-di-GMP-specific phosphodiesterase class I)/signal transduction histidine kinase/CheY-like chemotaxis protein